MIDTFFEDVEDSGFYRRDWQRGWGGGVRGLGTSIKEVTEIHAENAELTNCPKVRLQNG